MCGGMKPMNDDVKRDWRWSDGFLPQVRRILGNYALYLVDLQIASHQQDVSQATDMLIIVRGQKSVAVRLRRANYGYRDLTVRAYRSSGAETELSKILAGHGDFYLYGWTSGREIAEYMLIDLQQVRLTNLLSNRKIIMNHEHQTGFIAVPFTELLGNGCVVGHLVKDYPT